MIEHIDQVFIASRFGEFLHLRNELSSLINNNRRPKLKAINLDDGAVTSHPPLVECITHVKNSNFFILLLGDEYGSIPNGHDKSYTHLEYEEAYKNELETRILVFCIGESYKNNQINYSNNPIMKQWQRDLEDRHTIGFLTKPSSNEDISQLSEKITYQLLNTVYDRYFGQVQFGDESLDEDSDVGEDDIYGDESEIDKLENLDRIKTTNTHPAKSSDQINYEELYNYMTIIGPSKEAKMAIELGEKSLAVKSFQKILDHRPLDILSNYWLSKLYLAVGGKNYLRQAVELSARAAKVSESEGSSIRTSSAYQIASKASAELGDFHEAIHYADLSIEYAKNYAKSYAQKARVLLLQNPKNREDIKTLLETAINVHSGIIAELFNDPVFRHHRDLIKSLHDAYLLRKLNKLTSIIDVENKLIEYSSSTTYNMQSLPSNTKNFHEIITLSLSTQMSILKELANEYLMSLIKLGTNPIEAMQIPKAYAARKYFPVSSSVIEWYIEEGDIVQSNDRLFKFIKSDGRTSTHRWLENFPIRMTHVSYANSIINEDLLFEYVLPTEYDYPNLEADTEKYKKQLETITEKVDKIELQKSDPLNNSIKLGAIVLFVLSLIFGMMIFSEKPIISIFTILATLLIGNKIYGFLRSHWGLDILDDLKSEQSILSDKYNTSRNELQIKSDISNNTKNKLIKCIKLFEDNLFKIPKKIRKQASIKTLEDADIHINDWIMVKDDIELPERFMIKENILFEEYLFDINVKNKLYKVASFDKKINQVILSRDDSYFEYKNL